LAHAAPYIPNRGISMKLSATFSAAAVIVATG